MLNDLLTIERGMAKYGVASGAPHPDIKNMAKGWAFRVRLREDGVLSSLEVIQDAGNGTVWTLRDGQHNSFPGLKTAAGLLALDAQAREAHDRIWTSGKGSADRRNELLRMFSEFSIDRSQIGRWPSSGHKKRISERLDGLRRLADQPLNAAVPAAFARFLAALDASPSFLEQLTVALINRLGDGEDDHWLDRVRAALTGPIALAIDVKDMEFARDAGDPRQIDAITQALIGSTAAPGRSDAICAMSGMTTATLHKGNFPQPNLPILGQTYVFSRNKDIDSLHRYGLYADASFPIDAELVRRLAGAITTLTRPDRQGKTWRSIPGESGDTRDLLVISLADPAIPAADAVAEDEDVSGEAALDQLASRVIDQSEGIYEHANPEEEVTVLVLRTVDPANRKTIYHRKMTAAAFWKAARAWRDATRNTPDWLLFPFPGKEKSKMIMRGTPYVAPLSITPLSRIHFANGGRRPVDMIGTSAAEAFQLFLGDGDVGRRAKTLLRLIVQRHSNLLAGVAAARTKAGEHLKDFDPKSGLRRDALRSATWIGALLHHLGRSKEVYMSDAGFRLGQLLATADIVHIGYCLDIRNGSIPSSLLGNSLLGMASERPHEALKLLLKRWAPYAAWAKNEPRVHAEAEKSDKNKAISLRKALSHARRIGPIAAALCDQLREMDRDRNEVFQAELLLGYMAGLPRRTQRDRDAENEEL